ncbi:hypothetical protein Tdes44962_MAKER08995 [Teratosphaeria destructans]|uniref:Uncharacterized protein n=1 Tax=Teratosphaeria destructans TaxID=418781 RepID=A0A9W7SV71_9PEZI|nr:hypothetical protein Tdes44962_MAKER08995 [Teratosphaeria destructans]
MNKFKEVAKGGWKPQGDRPIHRDTWKKDLKGIATGRKEDPYAYAHEHHSAPLATLRDPASFAPPPKHRDYYPNGPAPAPSASTSGRAIEPPAPTGGLGSVVPAARPRPQEVVHEEPPEPPEPYRVDTSGLRTDNLPKPPVKRIGPGGADSPVHTPSPTLPPRTSSPALPARSGGGPPAPPRQTPSLPARSGAGPPPGLPPRMTENPTEHTPAPPPPYNEATKDPAYISQAAASSLGRAEVSVPGFGIGTQASTPQLPVAHTGQLSELQQRFQRMNTGAQARSSSPAASTPVPSAASAPLAAAAAKKPPPPPPPKKAALAGGGPPGTTAPPPIPISSKPKPSG